VIGLTLLGISDFALAAAGAAASGVAVGCLCTVTLVMMLDRSAPRSGTGAVIWTSPSMSASHWAVALGAVASLLGASAVFLAPPARALWPARRGLDCGTPVHSSVHDYDAETTSDRSFDQAGGLGAARRSGRILAGQAANLAGGVHGSIIGHAPHGAIR